MHTDEIVKNSVYGKPSFGIALADKENRIDLKIRLPGDFAQPHGFPKDGLPSSNSRDEYSSITSYDSDSEEWRTKESSG